MRFTENPQSFKELYWWKHWDKNRTERKEIFHCPTVILLTEIRLILSSFISESLIIKRKDDSEGINPRGQSQAMENNSQSIELGPTHRSSNMYLAGIQNIYGLITALCLYFAIFILNGSVYYG